MGFDAEFEMLNTKISQMEFECERYLEQIARCVSMELKSYEAIINSLIFIDGKYIMCCKCMNIGSDFNLHLFQLI